MGAIGLEIPLVHAPADDAAKRRLVTEAWAALHMRLGALLTRKASRDIVRTYLAIQASDGLRSGDWCATDRMMLLTFGDAAGLCSREMYVTHHWAELALAESWDELATLAEQHGAKLGARERSTAELLARRASLVFFFVGAKLCYAASDPEPKNDRAVYFPGADGAIARRLDALGKDRARVTAAIARGECGCDACDTVRAKLGLPLAPQPEKPVKKPAKKAPKKPRAKDAEGPIVPAFDLADAAILRDGDLAALKAAPARVVALDCETYAQRYKISAATLNALPTFPLRALNLYGNGFSSIPPAVPACRDLEVLSLRECSLRQPIGTSLDTLANLRALDLTGNSGKKVLDGLSLDLPRLEAIDYDVWSTPVPRALLRHNRLRHISLIGNESVDALADHPLESIHVGHRQTEHAVLKRWPLRHVETNNPDWSLPEHPSVEFVTANMLGSLQELPAWCRGLPNLRGLALFNVRALPDWFSELRSLEVLAIASSAPPESLKAIEKLPNLRVLLYAAIGAKRVPLDLRALEKLEVLYVTQGEVERAEDFVSGIDALPNLREFRYGAKYVVDHPAARRDDDYFTPLPLGAVWRWTLPKSDPLWWLGRFSTTKPWPTPPGASAE